MILLGLTAATSCSSTAADAGIYKKNLFDPESMIREFLVPDLMVQNSIFWEQQYFQMKKCKTSWK